MRTGRGPAFRNAVRIQRKTLFSVRGMWRYHLAETSHGGTFHRRRAPTLPLPEHRIMSSPCLLVTLFSKRTLGVCADLLAKRQPPAFTDAGEFGAGEFTPGKQAGKHQIEECRLVVQGARGNAEHLHPLPGWAADRREIRPGGSWSPAIPGLRAARRSTRLRAGRGGSCHRDRPTGRPWSQEIGSASWISRTASAMRHIVRAMTERTTSQWN